MPRGPTATPESRARRQRALKIYHREVAALARHTGKTQNEAQAHHAYLKNEGTLDAELERIGFNRLAVERELADEASGSRQDADAFAGRGDGDPMPETMKLIAAAQDFILRAGSARKARMLIDGVEHLRRIIEDADEPPAADAGPAGPEPGTEPGLAAAATTAAHQEPAGLNRAEQARLDEEIALDFPEVHGRESQATVPDQQAAGAG